MTYNEIVGYYKGLSKAAKALEYTRQRIYAWKRIRIPSGIQIEIAAKTPLRADRKAYADIAALAATARRAAKRINGR